MPVPLRGEDTYDMSFSGLKTNVINLVHNLEQKGEEIRIADMCRSFQDTAVGIVLDRATKAIKEYGIKQVVLAGGVSANSYLRAEMQKVCDKLGANIIIPPMWCCTDNAAMIAKVAEHLYDMKVFAGLDLGVDPNWSIEDWHKFEN